MKMFQSRRKSCLPLTLSRASFPSFFFMERKNCLNFYSNFFIFTSPFKYTENQVLSHLYFKKEEKRKERRKGRRKIEEKERKKKERKKKKKKEKNQSHLRCHHLIFFPIPIKVQGMVLIHLVHRSRR